jgi:hypothetical protein
MRSRYLAGAAAVWAVGYAAVYVAVIRSQDDGSVAWWYLGLVLVTAVTLATYAAGRASRAVLVTGLALGGIAALLGLLSIGILLVPAVAAAAAALGTARRTPLAT